MNPPSAPNPAPAPAPPDRTVSWGWILGTSLGLVLVLFALRLAGPSNLTDNDQERPAAYALDALVNGHWAVQYDWTGDIASKPPLYTWLVAGTSWLAGGANRFTLYLPCALSMLGATLLVAREVFRTVGSRAALLTGIFLLANPLSAKLVALARTDATFTFCVTLTAMLALGAWRRMLAGQPQAGWYPTWFAATLATLTKGPLGALLGLSGLLAYGVERRRGIRSPWTPVHLAGLALLLLLAGGWFLLAYRAAGDALVAKMIRSELVGHAVNREGAPPGLGLILVPAYFLSRFAPWSLLAFWGAWEAMRRPDARPEVRLLQRFATAWLLAGVVVFGLASHQRGDLVAPLMPAGAVLAAIPAARWLAPWTVRRLLSTAIAVSLALAIGVHVQHRLHRRAVYHESHGLQLLAEAFLRSGGDPTRLVHVDAPFALQFHLGTMLRALTVEQAAERLRQDPTLAVAVRDRGALARALGDRAEQLQTLVAWPLTEATNGVGVDIVGLRNR